MKDNSLKDTKIKSNNKDYNLKNILLKENKIDHSFLEKIKFLTLEDIIFLKLQSAAESLKGKLYNFPILKFSQDICREAVVKYALSTTQTKREACMILGLTKADFNRYVKKYNINLDE
jgi:hypothetical protein|tara:strand:+ start:277 stop:630 length:354 start_codon:yes stop_codon:yes gene_type:complete